MQKTAQKRSLLNKLREMTDVGGIATEKYFNPEFQQIMVQLREVDDGARAIASGEQIGEASVPTDGISLKDLLKSVKSNVNRREYMKAISDLGRFHKKLYDITHLLSLFKMNIDRVHEKFLFQDLDEDSKKHLQSFKGRWPNKGATYRPTHFIKEANILDFFTNIATERGRALAAWEKRYPNKVKDLKRDVASLLSLSERVLNLLLKSLKDMAKARATRNPDSYIASAEKILQVFKNYDEGSGGFKHFYETHVKGFLEKQEFFSPTKIDTTETPEDLGKKDVEVSTSLPSSNLDKTVTKQNTPMGTTTPRVSPPLTKIPPLPGIPQFRAPNIVEKIDTDTGEVLQVDQNTGKTYDVTKTNPLPPGVMQAPQIRIMPPPPPMRIKPAHRKFVNSLESLSSESPIVLAAHISRYAKSIFASDPDSAIVLLKIAKSIKG